MATSRGSGSPIDASPTKAFLPPRQRVNQRAVTRSEHIGESALAEKSLEYFRHGGKFKLTLIVVDDPDVKTPGGELVQKILGCLGIQVSGIELRNKHQQRAALDQTPHSGQRQRFSSLDVHLDESRLDGALGKEIVKRNGVHGDCFLCGAPS